MLIFDCNGVLVDSEPIATSVIAEEFRRAGVPITPDLARRFFLGRRPSDVLAAVEEATGRRLPGHFEVAVAAATQRRLRLELRPLPHVAYALSWLRGPKCVASSSSLDRVRLSLETTGLLQFFGSSLFSASEVPYGKPAPDLFLHAARRMGVQPSDCVVVEDSPNGIAAATAAGMTPIGFVGGSHADAQLAAQLTAAGARAIVVDMRALKGTVVELRGW
jgi:HAD superfamily hydrolase (TIGR01509 family)